MSLISGYDSDDDGVAGGAAHQGQPETEDEEGGGKGGEERGVDQVAQLQTRAPTAEPPSNSSASLAQAELPPDWEQCLDPETQTVYYWNQTTGETTWDRPVADLGQAFEDCEESPEDQGPPPPKRPRRNFVHNALATRASLELQEAEALRLSAAAAAGATAGSLPPEAFEPEQFLAAYETLLHFIDTSTSSPDLSSTSAIEASIRLRVQFETRLEDWRAEGLSDAFFAQRVMDMARDAMPSVDRGQKDIEVPPALMPLPTGWRESKDESGSVFFYHEEQGISTWERPTVGDSRHTTEMEAEALEALAPSEEKEENSAKLEEADARDRSMDKLPVTPDTARASLLNEESQESRSLLVYSSEECVTKTEQVAGLFSGFGIRTVRQLGDKYFLVTFSSKATALKALTHIANDAVPEHTLPQNGDASWTPSVLSTFVRCVSSDDLEQPLFESPSESFEDDAEYGSVIAFRDKGAASAQMSDRVESSSLSAKVKQQGPPAKPRRKHAMKDPKLRAQIEKWQSVS